MNTSEQAAKRKAAELEKAAQRAAQMRVEREQADPSPNLNPSPNPNPSPNQAEQRRREEAAKLKEHRRSLVHKSRGADVLKREPFKPQLSARRPTQAHSPHWAPRAVRA